MVNKRSIHYKNQVHYVRKVSGRGKGRVHIYHENKVMKIAKFSSKLHYELYKLLQKELWATQKELQIKNKNNMYMIGEPLTKKEAEKVYRRFYELVPTRLMHIFLHRELAITLAIASVRDKIKTLEFIDSGMMSRTCVIGTDPTEVLVFWRDVEKWLLERQKEILKQNKD